MQETGRWAPGGRTALDGLRAGGEDGGPLSDAAEWFDRAAHDLRGRAPARRLSQAGQLRTVARLIAVMGSVPRDRDTLAALHLVFTLATLAETLADLREAQDRLHQARAGTCQGIEANGS